VDDVPVHDVDPQEDWGHQPIDDHLPHHDDPGFDIFS